MPIEIPDMPPAIAKALQTGLRKFAVPASPASPDATAPSSVKPSIARNSRVISRSIEAALAADKPGGVGASTIVLGLDELVASSSLRKAKAKLWVQLLPAGESGESAMAEVDKAAAKLTSIAEGPEVKALAKRINGLAAQQTRSPVRQELTLIRVPALHLTAIWLKGAAGEAADDVVIPNDGPIAPLVPGQRYALAEFQGIVAAMAAERLAKTTDDMGG
ncbi:hypothetical protein [Variovorax rhizosphaerae]|uniref:DUF1631 family protein n=1 Tax=Variovorax rhizosphaerae TaxID=1836200 RepID=A0ABU8WZB3_9BURK